MTDTTETFEVQALILAGDRGGQWEEVGAAALPLHEAEPLAAELRTDRQPVRVVPFGTGPNPRVGDIVPGGGIYTDDEAAPMHPDGKRYAQGGVIWVTPEQADNAELFGWHRTGQVKGTVAAGDLIVQVEL